MSKGIHATTGQGMNEENPALPVSDTDSAVSADIVRSIIKESILQKNPTNGAAINFLLFGGFGIPGIIDDAKLVSDVSKKINDPNKVAEQFTQDMALSLITDLASLAIQEALEKAGVGAVKVVNGLTFLGILFSVEKIGNGEMPKDSKHAQGINIDEVTNPDELTKPGDVDLTEGKTVVKVPKSEKPGNASDDPKILSGGGGSVGGLGGGNNSGSSGGGADPGGVGNANKGGDKPGAGNGGKLDFSNEPMVITAGGSKKDDDDIPKHQK